CEPFVIGRSPRLFEIECGERPDFVLAFGNRLGAHVDDRTRRQLPGLDTADELERREHRPRSAGKSVPRLVFHELRTPPLPARCDPKCDAGSRAMVNAVLMRLDARHA